MRVFFLIVYLMFYSLHASEEQIVVKLATDSQLASLYLDSFKEDPSQFGKSYLTELEKILQFDLDHNGMTKVVGKNQDRQALIAKENKFDSFDQAGWRQLNINFAVKVKLTNQKITAAVFDVTKNKIKVVEEVQLNGNLSQDRKQMHLIADAIHHALCGKNGVCNTKVLYTVRTKKSEQNSEQWVTEVWEADYDGANSRQLTKEGCLCVTPTYIPAKPGMRSNHFFYVSYRVGQPKIFAAAIKDGVGKRISFLRGNQFMPAINQERNQIAFISDIAGNPDLFVQDFSLEQGPIGKPRQIFSAPKGAQGSPTFSPDGKKIAFVSNKDGTARIYALDIPNENVSLSSLKPFLISKRNKDNTSPVWSPDGTKIAYSSSTQGTRQIWVYDFKTAKEFQLTQGSGHKENPTWAPDSLHLLFNSSTNTNCELYLVNLNQPEAIKISKGPGEKRFPCWEPAAIIR